MATTYPSTEIPEIYLEGKHADIKASRNEDFHYSWVIGKAQLLTVEYIPANYPALTVSVGPETVEWMRARLEEIGFDIEE